MGSSNPSDPNADTAEGIAEDGAEEGADASVDVENDADAADADAADADAADADAADDDAADDEDADEDADGDGCPEDVSVLYESVLYGSELFLDTIWTSGVLEPCTPVAHPLVVPGDARWEVQLRGVPSDARAVVYGPEFARAASAGEPPASLAESPPAGPDGGAEVTFTAPVSGEYFVVVERADGSTESPYEARAVCLQGCTLETTRYPVVMVHGYAGADNYFGLLEYFYDVPGPLRARGYSIHTPVTDPLALSSHRAEQLAEQIDTILETTGASKVNIIAHSQGGLDSRYLISALGYHERVASLTTIATPHRGVPAAIFEFVTVQSFAPEVLEEFNAMYPDHPDVEYWSWSARSCSRLAFRCQREMNGEVIEILLVAPFALLSRYGHNDGIVTTDSMPWGEHLGLLSADHFDQIGQVADGSRPNDPFDHRAFYLSEVRRLSSAGY